MAQQAFEPGVSVAQLALQHQLNSNMVFKWRRQLCAGPDTFKVELLELSGRFLSKGFAPISRAHLKTLFEVLPQ
ncbi:transposase [Massilia sp. METH4]|uniref:transposase n=1 Tax=Massilia sp. METH4 TaxID=3123041 RepID=UPI0030CC7D27